MIKPSTTTVKAYKTKVRILGNILFLAINGKADFGY